MKKLLSILLLVSTLIFGQIDTDKTFTKAFNSGSTTGAISSFVQINDSIYWTAGSSQLLYKMPVDGSNAYQMCGTATFGGTGNAPFIHGRNNGLVVYHDSLYSLSPYASSVLRRYNLNNTYTDYAAPNIPNWGQWTTGWSKPTVYKDSIVNVFQDNGYGTGNYISRYKDAWASDKLTKAGMTQAEDYYPSQVFTFKDTLFMITGPSNTDWTDYNYITGKTILWKYNGNG